MLNFWKCFERLGGRGGSLWPICGNIRDSHIILSPEHTIAILLPSQGVLLLVQKSAQIKPFSEEKWDELNIFFLQELLHFSISFFFIFGRLLLPVIDICFDWQKYQNIKPSSFINQAVSYVFGTVCKKIVQSLFRSKERKNKLNDRNKLLWGSDAYPIIQSKVLTKDETEEKKE